MGQFATPVESIPTYNLLFLVDCYDGGLGMEQPKLAKIKSGWAALGNGWAVHGRTQEEALERFSQAQVRHSEIAKRPLPEPSQAQT